MAKKRNLILKSKEPFTRVPNKLWQLGPLLSKEERRIYPYAKGVYLAFAGSGEAFNPGIRYLTETLGYSKDTIQKALHFLTIKNILRLVRKSHGHRDEYEFTSPGDWKLTDSTTPKKDTSSETKDTACVDAGHLVSNTTGHNNELSPMKDTINNDDEIESAPSFSLQEKKKPKEEKDTDWTYQYLGDFTLEDYQTLVTGHDIDRIFEQAHRVFTDPKTRTTFRQNYIPKLEASVAECIGNIVEKGRAPIFDNSLMKLRLDYFLKKRFKIIDEEKPYMAFGGYICQDLRDKALEVFGRYQRYCQDKNICLEMERYDPVSIFCEIIGRANYLGIITEVEQNLFKIVESCFGSEIVRDSQENGGSLLEVLVRCWITSNNHIAKNGLSSKLARIWCDLWFAFSQKAKFLVPDWADRSPDDFYWAFYDDVTKLERMCNTTPELWAWEEKIKLGEISEDRNSPAGFLEFLQKVA